MDSFYPKFDEVELVLVDDDNDFYDPLETNFECEDENEDTKLQLNDTVCEESQFHWSADETTNHSSLDENNSLDLVNSNKTVKKETPYENFAYNYDNTSNHIGKFEISNEDSNQSSEMGQDSFQNNDSNIFSDEPVNECKYDPDEILKTTIELKQNQKISDKVEKNVKKEDVVQTEKIKIKTRHMKNTQEKIMKVMDKGKCLIKKECKTKKKLPKEDKKIESSGEKQTRHYSKRNEIPKDVVHNEAYDKKLLNCKICNIQFERSPFFTEHMRAKHSIDKPFECFICSKAYRISSLLAEHIRYHFGEKPYKCKFCDRSFSQLQPYKAHIRKTHTLERPYKCNFVYENNIKCEESFHDTKTYKFHMREHTNEQPFTCEYCAKKFNHSGTYQAHMRIHTNERPYQCVQCGKSFAQISTHKAHMLTHSEEFRFPCTEPGCDKKFKQANNLKLHLRVHTKETPYKCEECGRGFAQLVTYRNHKRIHTGEKPFQCTYVDCGKCFRHRNSYRRHLQTHTGEKPFECKVCFKRLSQTSSFVSHMRRHEKPEKS